MRNVIFIFILAHITWMVDSFLNFVDKAVALFLNIVQTPLAPFEIYLNKKLGRSRYMD